MTPVTTLASLVTELTRKGLLRDGLQLYVFGSAIGASGTPKDIDLLLIYADGLLAEAHALAEAVRSTLAAPPYDVVVASETEAKQLDLIAKQGAVPIWPTA